MKIQKPNGSLISHLNKIKTFLNNRGNIFIQKDKTVSYNLHKAIIYKELSSSQPFNIYCKDIKISNNCTFIEAKNNLVFQNKKGKQFIPLHQDKLEQIDFFDNLVQSTFNSFTKLTSIDSNNKNDFFILKNKELYCLKNTPLLFNLLDIDNIFNLYPYTIFELYQGDKLYFKSSQVIIIITNCLYY